MSQLGNRPGQFHARRPRADDGYRHQLLAHFSIRFDFRLLECAEDLAANDHGIAQAF